MKITEQNSVNFNAVSGNEPGRKEKNETGVSDHLVRYYAIWDRHQYWFYLVQTCRPYVYLTVPCLIICMALLVSLIERCSKN